MSNSIQIKRGVGRPNNKLLPFELGFDTSEGFLYIGGPLEEGSLGLAKEIKVHWAQSSDNAQSAQNAEKLTTPRKIEVSLSKENSINFDGSADLILGVSGILPVSKGGIGLSKLETGKALIANGESSISFREIKNNTSLAPLGWTSKEQGISLVTLNTLAYWDGCYKDSYSNLAFCKQGEFGTIVTKNINDYLSTSGGTVIASTNNDNTIKWPIILQTTYGFYPGGDEAPSGWGCGIKFRNAGDSENKWSGLAAYAVDSWSNTTGLKFLTHTNDGTEYTFTMVRDRFYAPKLVTSAFGTSAPSGTGVEGQLYFQVVSE